jgi:hypothetical protein
METDDEDFLTSYLLYIAAAIVAIGIAGVSSFFLMIR